MQNQAVTTPLWAQWEGFTPSAWAGGSCPIQRPLWGSPISCNHSVKSWDLVLDLFLVYLFFWVVSCSITCISRLSLQIPGKKGIQEPNPFKANSSEEGEPKLLSDAAIHHSPWLVPQGKQVQPNSLRVPFLSKLCHSRSGAFAWEMQVQEREYFLQLVLWSKPPRTKEQATQTAVQWLVLLGRKSSGWVWTVIMKQFVLFVWQLHILQIHQNAQCPQNISGMATTLAEWDFCHRWFSLEGSSPFPDPSPFLDPSLGNSSVCRN